MYKTEIENYGACEDAVEFRKGFATFEEAWSACPRGDWMLLIAKKLDVDLRTLTLAKVRCASTVRHLMKDERSLKALDVAMLFAEGRATAEEMAYAAYAAYARAAAARAESPDYYLILSADICLDVLIEMKSPGCEFLFLCETSASA